jgi:hypothetical protein
LTRLQVVNCIHSLGTMDTLILRAFGSWLYSSHVSISHGFYLFTSSLVYLNLCKKGKTFCFCVRQRMEEASRVRKEPLLSPSLVGPHAVLLYFLFLLTGTRVLGSSDKPRVAIGSLGEHGFWNARSSCGLWRRRRSGSARPSIRVHAILVSEHKRSEKAIFGVLTSRSRFLRKITTGGNTMSSFRT